MDYIAVKDLKKTKELWEKLDREKELIITRDGRPSALLISVSPETIDDSLREIRRALFSAAVSRVRQRTTGQPPEDQTIETEIRQSRRERGIS